MNTLSLHLPGYRISSLIYRGDGRVVYRARREEDSLPVAVETLDSNYPNRQQIACIKREMYISNHLAGIEGIRKVYNLVPHGSGNLALIIELYSGSFRTRLIQAGGRGLALDEALDLTIRVTR